ncbi:MAG: beta-ketoacyl synthase N-terminal-like domain-containing protein [Scytonema sp. PMC 1069.18]|nr:beta-ketoacyl synthase N-terminal-like domain-containing protein [Scytonema sp. PMC 1069.18]MEC4882109.1 beta-ketoacyl synthase N-terminal-like domain-containing protein [Scytonema sp. PMC 1070.18]
MEAIAIIGIGCRFPGAKNSKGFWQLLCDGKDAITEVSPDRWDINALYDPKPGTPGKMSTRWGGFLEEVDRFDPHFFGIAPKEAVYMDPQQRLLLEVAWEALEDAGQVVEKLARTATGVFIGISSVDYHQRLQGSYSRINAYMGTGNAFSIAANRLSYLFDFRGPSMAIDTACSSSLVAVHLACQSLRSGESNLVLAGGVNLLLSPELTIIFSQAQMMAPDGRCKTFDARANGYVRGEGCGIVILKRLSDAMRDNDNIIAVIRGSAMNQDGHSNGLTAPNGLAQEALIQQAITNAGVQASQIGYVELHGTGTSLGDPIEAEALGNVLAGDRPSDKRCIVGSVKTNIGHLEAAAGIAGLIKVALILQNRQIPPSLHFQRANPYIPFNKLPLKVQQALEPFPDNDGLMLAGVSSFGFGGTNAHIILESIFSNINSLLPTTTHSSRATNHLLPLSARNLEALHSLARSYQEFLVREPGTSLSDICYTASVRRTHHEHRLSLVFRNREELDQLLESFLHREARFGQIFGQKRRKHRHKLVFVFSGQGPQWWGMGRELLSQEPVFKAAIQQCDDLLSKYADWSLLDEFTVPESQSRLGDTEIAQPAIFALQVALTALWKSWGIEPSAVVGHSIGEVAAAYVAGVLSWEDAVRVVYHRGRLMQQGTGKGKMAVVELSIDRAEELVAQYAGRLSIAAINSPTSIVLSGEAAALEEVLTLAQQQQIFCKMLRVNYAFHSPQMELFQDEVVRSLAGLSPQTPSIPILSTVTGKPWENPDFDAAYWGRNIREPVRFATAINYLLETKHNLFLELSPHPVLAMNISQCLRLCEREGTVLPSLRRQEGEQLVMLNSLGTLYTQGYPVDWSRLYPAGKQVSLPSYPWQRERYWVEKDTSVWVKTEPTAPRVTEETMVSGTDNVPAKTEPEITRNQLLAVTPQERRTLLESYLSRLLTRVMGLSASKVDLQQPLFSLGLDSLMAVELRNQIQAKLDVVVPIEYFAGLSVTDFVTQVQLLVEGEALQETPKVTETNLWVTRPKPNPQASLRLFCFPYAGSGASIFYSWLEELPNNIELLPIQLPGREDRLGETPFNRLKPLIETLIPQLSSYLDAPFVFFGHSLGALIAFELARELRKQNLPTPVQLFVSGSRAPQVPDLDAPIHKLPEPKFLESLRRLNGTRDEVLQNPEVMQLFLPALRADFAILETYFYSTQEPLNCPITALGGKEDSRVNPEQLAAWREQTHSEFSIKMFPGDHFFLHSDRTLVLQTIVQEIQKPILKS